MARSLRQVCSSALQGVLLRFDLLAIELREEKERFLGFLLLGMLVVLAAFMAFLVLNLTILVLAGDEHQVVVLLWMLGFYLLLALALGLGMWRKVRTAPLPFAATVEELKKDQALFSGR